MRDAMERPCRGDHLGVRRQMDFLSEFTRNPVEGDMGLVLQQVSLILYDVLGRRVRQLWQGPLGAGSHRFVWDGRDATGKAVAAGVYFYKVEVDGQIEAKKATKLP